MRAWNADGEGYLNSVNNHAFSDIEWLDWVFGEVDSTLKGRRFPNELGTWTWILMGGLTAEGILMNFNRLTVPKM
jgi:hypothetical protein